VVVEEGEVGEEELLVVIDELVLDGSIEPFVVSVHLW